MNRALTNRKSIRLRTEQYKQLTKHISQLSNYQNSNYVKIDSQDGSLNVGPEIIQDTIIRLALDLWLLLDKEFKADGLSMADMYYLQKVIDPKQSPYKNELFNHLLKVLPN